MVIPLFLIARDGINIDKLIYYEASTISRISFYRYGKDIGS